MSTEAIQVLVVEDNPADAALLHATLAESTYGRFEVTHVRRLAEALVKMAKKKFDVVLLDLGLPDSQGIPTMERVRKQSRAMPVVVLTGLNDNVTGMKALQGGAQDYLVKGETAGNVMGRAIRYAVERKRAEEAFAVAEQRLALAVDAVQLGIWDWDLHTGQIVWSDQQMHLFGLDKFDGRYETFERCVHPDDLPAVQNIVTHARKSGEAYFHEYRVIWPDGSTHWLESRGRVLTDEQKRPIRMMGTILDITQRKTSEEAARVRDAELAHMSRVNTMGQMASGLAHELNQPLGAILNYTSVCLTHAESDKVIHGKMATALGEIMNETRRAGAIISRLRAFVRKQQPQSVPVDVNELVEESINLVESELRHQNIRPRLQLADKLPDVLADPIQIEQVLVNLIYNALEAIAENKSGKNTLTVRTTLQEDGRLIEVSVVDSGCGMSPETLARLFEPFFTTKAQGLGMGLNISRSIIESHGGRLLATPNSDEGMTFSFTLLVA